MVGGRGMLGPGVVAVWRRGLEKGCRRGVARSL